ncbi:MAG: iduronate-2-sulfatase [Planctomycetota bacterium]|nr:MAG: iduronate-2-sulfatase [Planctomycetota bacterium]
MLTRLMLPMLAGLLLGIRGGLATEPLNVLFIPIDDLNHWVGHLGAHPQARTPNIDRLAAAGVSFTHAYCAAPACNPSRIALMSGLRPSTSGCYDNGQDWRPYVEIDKLLNSHLLDHGYACYGAGKIYHGSYGNTDRWTEFHKSSNTKLRRHPTAKDDGVGGIKFYPLDNSDEDMPDYKNVSWAIEQLRREHDRPFFLAIGLHKPHMPFSVPKKWFDMFPLESIELPPHIENDLADVPPEGVKMARPEGDHAKILASGRWKEAVQAYLATIAFADAQVGRLLDALEASPYAKNTVVCLWSDHGWSLGEKEHWRKFALWEEPTRTVYIWKVPGLTPAGTPCHRPVDLMSVYPTMCTVLGLPRPAHVEGADIRPLLANPQADWELPALTTFHRNNHSLRDATWRYIRYAEGGEELYNHATDPHEWTNLANDPKYAPVKERLERFFPARNAPELPRVR